jgi:hypothetical protein
MAATSIKAGLVQAPRGMGDNRETNAINHFGFAHEALQAQIESSQSLMAFPAIAHK